MQKSLEHLIQGYRQFQKKYAAGDQAVMQRLSYHGQKPEHMVVSCCDSRVDPTLIFQTAPGDLFVTRNVANLVPPYESDKMHHGTSAALEFGVCYLNVKHLIIMGHSQCGGVQARCDHSVLHQDDFISNWVSMIPSEKGLSVDDTAKAALVQSYENSLTFPWIKSRVEKNQLQIHLWFFDIKTATIEAYDFNKKTFLPLS